MLKPSFSLHLLAAASLLNREFSHLLLRRCRRPIIFYCRACIAQSARMVMCDQQNLYTYVECCMCSFNFIKKRYFSERGILDLRAARTLGNYLRKTGEFLRKNWKSSSEKTWEWPWEKLEVFFRKNWKSSSEKTGSVPEEKHEKVLVKTGRDPKKNWKNFLGKTWEWPWEKLEKFIRETGRISLGKTGRDS